MRNSDSHPGESKGKHSVMNSLKQASLCCLGTSLEDLQQPSILVTGDSISDRIVGRSE